MLHFYVNTQTLIIEKKCYRFISGRDGYIPEVKGREGDFKTPIGTYSLRYGLYRADRLPAPKSKLRFHPIHYDDGWCDDPNDIAYNLPVKRPYPASTEAMSREDGVYDIVIVMSHNDSPVRPNLGSAVFLHICRPDHRPTAGCLAVDPETMTQILPRLEPRLAVIVRETP